MDSETSVFINKLLRNDGPGFLLFRVFVVMGLLYALLQFAMPLTPLFELYLESLHSSASQFVTWVGLDHEADWYRDYGELKTDTFAKVTINQSSSGLLELGFVLAAILVWPATKLRKLVFFVLAVLLVFGLAVLRNAAGLLIDHYLPLYLDMAVGYGIPIALLLVLFVFFFTYINGTNSRK